MKTVTASGKEYTLYHTTGKVLSSSKNLSTTVSATGGGNSQVNVRSPLLFTIRYFWQMLLAKNMLFSYKTLI